MAAIVGPSVIDLEYKFDVKIEDFTITFVTSSIAAMAGAIVLGFLYNKLALYFQVVETRREIIQY